MSDMSTLDFLLMMCLIWGMKERREEMLSILVQVSGVAVKDLEAYILSQL